MKQCTKVIPFDTAEFLKSQEGRDLHLEESFKTGDPAQIAMELGNAVRAQGIMNIATNTELTCKHLNANFSNTGNPTLKTIILVLQSLGYQLTIVPKRNHEGG